VAWVVAIGGACCFGAAGTWFLRAVRVDAGVPDEPEEPQRRQRLAIARK